VPPRIFCSFQSGISYLNANACCWGTRSLYYTPRCYAWEFIQAWNRTYERWSSEKSDLPTQIIRLIESSWVKARIDWIEVDEVTHFIWFYLENEVPTWWHTVISLLAKPDTALLHHTQQSLGSVNIKRFTHNAKLPAFGTNESTISNCLRECEVELCRTPSVTRAFRQVQIDDIMYVSVLDRYPLNCTVNSHSCMRHGRLRSKYLHGINCSV